MNPIVTRYQAQARMDELHREAQRARLAASASGTASDVSRLRAAVGRWLIATGQRLTPTPTIDTIGYRR